MSARNRFRTSLTASLVFLAVISVAEAKYSGGSGTVEDPYRIALGETPKDGDKHIIPTDDIDLDPTLRDGKISDGANGLPAREFRRAPPRQEQNMRSANVLRAYRHSVRFQYPNAPMKGDQQC